MQLTWGKYKGKRMEEVPEAYLRFLLNPVFTDKQGRTVDLTARVTEEMRGEIGRLLDASRYSKSRLGGGAGERTEYVIEFLGDCCFAEIEFGGWETAPVFGDLSAALAWLAEKVKPRDPEDSMQANIDPEDDRVLIWEVLPSGHKKVVWHFSGWHWDAEEFGGLEQGKLLGHKDSLYAESND